MRQPIAAIAILTAALIAGYLALNATAGRPSPIMQYLRADDKVNLPPPPPLSQNDAAEFRQTLRSVMAAYEHSNVENQSASLAERAQQALSGTCYLTAMKDLERLVSEKEGARRWRPLLGECLLNLALYDRALVTFEQVRKDEPTRAAGYIGISRSRYGRGERSEAVQILGEAAKYLVDGPPSERVFIAREYEVLLRPEEGAEQAGLAVKASPSDSVAATLYAKLLAEGRRYDEANVVLDRVLAADPDEVRANIVLAQLLSNPRNPRRDLARAEHHFLITLSRSKTAPQDYDALAAIYLEQKRWKQAAFTLTLLLREDSDSASARLRLAKAYSEMGMRTESELQRRIAEVLVRRDTRESELRSRLTEQPADPHLRLMIGLHYLTYGQFARSFPHLQAAHALDPGSAETTAALKRLFSQAGIQEAYRKLIRT